MFTLHQIKNLLDSFGGRLENQSNFNRITDVKNLDNATTTSLVFIDRNSKDKDTLFKKTNAIVIICDYLPSDETIYKDKCLIIVDNPKLFFAKLVNQSYKSELNEIHTSSIIDKRAKIGKQCYIGPNVSIGNAEIGNNVYIHSNCSIYDNVKIGNNVIIDAGCVIGAAGFGFVKDNDGKLIRVPQLGQVIIEDDVEIGANVCIDRGALQNTIIRTGVKIDDLILIAHNVEIGEHTLIVGATNIGGSVKIGKRCWIGSSRILNKINIGNDVTVGYGAVVLKSITDGKTYIGNPALEVSEYSKIQYKLRKYAKK